MSFMDRVVYKPLDMAPPEGDGEEQDVECEIERPFPRLSHSYKQYRGSFPNKTDYYFGWHQLRLLLYLLASLLILIFIVELSTQGQIKQSSAATRSISSEEENIAEQLIREKNQSEVSAINYSSTNRPPINIAQYDTYLSSVLLERNSQPNSTTFDDLHFPNDDQQHHSSNVSNWWTLKSRDKYITVTNYIRAMKSFGHESSLTLTTQATTEFMYHTLELCKRWDGPISIAVFCPGPEMSIAITLIKFMRECLPKPLSACIKDKVSWHLVYNKSLAPTKNTINFPRFQLDAQSYPLFVNQNQCPKVAGPEPSDSIKQFEEELRKKNNLFPLTYRQHIQLPYPINVLRNVARLEATTKYVLASDIELYPSIKLVPLFINYMINHNIRKEYPHITRYSFTLPIFEVKANISAPKTKQDLVHLMEQGDAIFFHKWVCDACQNFPNRLDWLETDKYGHEDFKSDSEIVIFEITQRDKSKDSWEPIFIGTNDDPLYDDRLTWDGRRDKMGQMYEMCLQDYHLLVLGNAFLVHASGIKHIDKNDNMKRYKYIRENNAIYDATMLQLQKQYSNSSNIDRC